MRKDLDDRSHTSANQPSVMDTRHMTIADLIAKLQTLPLELSVMLTVNEGGVDHARAVRVTDVARHRFDWSFTPIGQFRELPDDNTVGEPFKAVVLE